MNLKSKVGMARGPVLHILLIIIIVGISYMVAGVFVMIRFEPCLIAYRSLNTHPLLSIAGL